MPTQTQQKQRLKKAKRHVLPVRLDTQAHAELQQQAKAEQRSMSFIALRRYNAGLRLEKQKSN
ncbi:hypothetical protein [Faucicola atlantae]|uniref:Ribbon-helix-helix protein CopG domain-containing protein n=1 Tax=Faucicola atlantae TaxID=34059 RepID=A0A1B8QD48_9GAMM|nr:hypothetical protein [Moraxella atlantae]OBX79152.1 hypothetical protein A9306_09070 [Moraxella atlantae]